MIRKQCIPLFFAELDGAIKVLSDFVAKNSGDNSLARFDLVYDGNVKQWLKFANSLKLRLAIRISYADPVLAKTKAEEAVNDPNGLLLTNADNALVIAGKGVPTRNGLWVDDISYKDTRMNASAGFNWSVSPVLGRYKAFCYHSPFTYAYKDFRCA